MYVYREISFQFNERFRNDIYVKINLHAGKANVTAIRKKECDKE